MVLELDEIRELYVTFKIYTPDVRLPQNSFVFISYTFAAYL